jgi:methyl-accepting chemotaxis protein
MYKFSTIEKIVGALIVFTIILLILLLLFIGRANEWFRPMVPYYTILNNASGVSKGAKITYKGITIGKISKVELLPDETFKVDIYIYREFTNKIKSDSLFVAKSPLFGGKSFEIVSGSAEGDFVMPGEIIYSLDTYEGKVLAKLKGYYSSDEDISKIVNNVSTITAMIINYLSEGGELSSVLKNINNLLLTANETIYDLKSSTLPKVDNLVDKRIGELIDTLIVSLNKLKALLESESISKSLNNTEKITKDISVLSEELKNNKDNISSLIKNLEKITKNLGEITENLKKIVK